MAESRAIFDVKYTLTYVAIGSGNQLDTFTLGVSPSVASTPSLTGNTIFGSIPANSVYAGCEIDVNAAFAIAPLPQIYRQPPAGSRSEGAKIEVYYTAYTPLVSHCEYKLIVRTAVPTLADGTVLPPLKSPAAGRIILFDEKKFQGAYKIIDFSDSNLALSHGGFTSTERIGGAPGDADAKGRGFFNNRASSFIVASGQWRLFRDVAFERAYTNPKSSSSGLFGPGHYEDVTLCGIEDDQISSLWCEKM